MKGLLKPLESFNSTIPVNKDYSGLEDALHYLSWSSILWIVNILRIQGPRFPLLLSPLVCAMLLVLEVLAGSSPRAALLTVCPGLGHKHLPVCEGEMIALFCTECSVNAYVFQMQRAWRLETFGSSL